MANSIGTQQEVVVLGQMRTLADAIDRIRMLHACSAPSEIGDWDARYVLEGEFIDKALLAYEGFREFMSREVLPFVRDMRSARAA